MFFRILKSLIVLIIGFSMVACSSASKKEEAPAVKEDKSANSRAFSDPVEEVNAMLAGLRYPDGETRPGFSYKKADVANDFAAWAEKNVVIIKSALGKVPADYVLEITGHTDAVGPEQPEGDKKGNMYYSEIRAKAMKDALVAKGVPAGKIVTRGVGSSNTVSGLDPKDPKNRRVTFSFIRQEAAPQNQ